MADRSVDEPPPYFDALFARLEAGDPAATAAFGRHVHWGYWENPEAADGTGEDYARAAEALCRAVCDAAPVADGMRVLDVGCGFGGTIASLNERFKNLDMVGVNIDPRQLARAADTVHMTNGNRVRWVQGDACDLPLSGPFDVVLAVECVFHFPSRAKFLSEAARVLKPGGRLALSDFLPTPEGLPLLRSQAAGHADTLASYGKVDFFCGEEEYRKLAEAAGFRDFAGRNITPHTMPTYSFLRGTATGWQSHTTSKAYQTATKRLEVASRHDMLRYTIVSATASR
jgi:ubiquinone/menaquinone biosynthesis C-methylase UbiE